MASIAWPVVRSSPGRERQRGAQRVGFPAALPLGSGHYVTIKVPRRSVGFGSEERHKRHRLVSVHW